MSSEGYPRRTLQLTHDHFFSTCVHTMADVDRALLSYKKAKAIALTYREFQATLPHIKNI